MVRPRKLSPKAVGFRQKTFLGETPSVASSTESAGRQEKRDKLLSPDRRTAEELHELQLQREKNAEAVPPSPTGTTFVRSDEPLPRAFEALWVAAELCDAQAADPQAQLPAGIIVGNTFTSASVTPSLLRPQLNVV